MFFQKSDIINEESNVNTMFLENTLDKSYKFTPLIENFDFVNSVLSEGEDILNEAIVIDKMVNNYMEKGEDHKGLKGRLKNILSLNKKSDDELTNKICSKQAMDNACQQSSGLENALRTLISMIGAIGIWKLLSKLLTSYGADQYAAGYAAGKKHAYKIVLIVALSIIGLTIITFVIYRIWKKKKGLSNEEQSSVKETIKNVENCKNMVSKDDENKGLVKKFDGILSNLKATLK